MTAGKTAAKLIVRVFFIDSPEQTGGGGDR